MTAATLLMDLARLGIRVEADGERLRYYPRHALTPDLLDRLRTHKAELLAMLRPALPPVTWGRTACRRLVGNGFPPIPPTIPPAPILATPAIICPCCGRRRVLPELRGLTGGRCWPCWAR